MAIKKGDKIKVDYTGTLYAGTVFDSSEGRGPLEFVVGSGQLIKGFDDAVVGMKKGEEKTVKLNSAEDYGEHNSSFAKKVPRSQLPLDQEPKLGMTLGLNLPDGRQLPALITEVNDAEITIDFNHPLAGKNLTFKIKIVEC